MSTFSYYRKIREIDLDFLGHVNHANYLSLFEEARWELLAESGFGFAELQREGIAPVILGVNIQYRKEIHNREQIHIETSTSGTIAKVDRLEQVMYNEEGRIAATATVTYGIMDVETRKLIEPPSIWLEALGVKA